MLHATHTESGSVLVTMDDIRASHDLHGKRSTSVVMTRDEARHLADCLDVAANGHSNLVPIANGEYFVVLTGVGEVIMRYTADLTHTWETRIPWDDADPDNDAVARVIAALYNREN